MPTGRRSYSVRVAGLFFVTVDVFAIKTTLQKDLWGGRRHCSMTIEEEREFLAQWIEKATIGGVLTVPPIHAALMKRLGRDIPMSTTYRLLARHNWRKVQPDTKHPKSDPAVQDEFKKKSPKRWQPPV